jgi:D-beta-D-heptose 7-phosphate kinase/D-beta-D-heptose 1-phosphate adenosyltransferase
MILFSGHSTEIHLPTQARAVFDVSGAGDTVAAVMALGLAIWHNSLLAATVANVAAGVVVGKMGTATISRGELAKDLANLGVGLPEDCP